MRMLFWSLKQRFDRIERIKTIMLASYLFWNKMRWSDPFLTGLSTLIFSRESKWISITSCVFEHSIFLALLSIEFVQIQSSLRSFSINFSFRCSKICSLSKENICKQLKICLFTSLFVSDFPNSLIFLLKWKNSPD